MAVNISVKLNSSWVLERPKSPATFVRHKNMESVSMSWKKTVLLKFVCLRFMLSNHTLDPLQSPCSFIHCYCIGISCWWPSLWHWYCIGIGCRWPCHSIGTAWYYSTGVQIVSCTLSDDSVLSESTGLFNPVLCVSQWNSSWQKNSQSDCVFQIRLGLEENDSPLHLVTSTGFLKA